MHQLCEPDVYVYTAKGQPVSSWGMLLLSSCKRRPEARRRHIDEIIEQYSGSSRSGLQWLTTVVDK